MRILVVHNYYQHKGGEDVVFHQEVEALKKDHQVETITFQNRKGLHGLIQFALYPWNIFAATKILRKAREFRADIVHIHNLHYAIGPLVIRQLHQSGYKIVQTLHNYRIICPSATLFADGKIFKASLTEDFPSTALQKKVLDHSWLKTFLTAFTYYFHRKIKTWEKVHKFLVLSEFAKSILVNSRLGLKESKFAIKSNFLPQPKPLQAKSQNHFIYIGRLSEEKGIIPLLAAIKNTTYELKVLGTGPQLDEVLQIANTSTNIYYLGYLSQEEVSIELNNSAALIVPSVCYEGIPMTIIQSFAHGIPVISSNIGILEQMVKPFKTGLHFDIHDKKSILDTLEIWQELSSDQRAQMIQNCKDEYSNKYTEQYNMKVLNDIYSTILNKN